MNESSLRRKSNLQQCALSAFIKNGIRKDRAGKKNTSYPSETDACKEAESSLAWHDHVARREKLERAISSTLFMKKERQNLEENGRTLDRNNPPTTSGSSNQGHAEKMRDEANLQSSVGASLHDALLQSVECSHVASQLHERLQGECAREICRSDPNWEESFGQLGTVLEGMERFYNRALQYLYLQFALATHPEALRVGKPLSVDQVMDLSSCDEVDALLHSHLNICTILKIRRHQLAQSEVKSE